MYSYNRVFALALSSPYIATLRPKYILLGYKEPKRLILQNFKRFTGSVMVTQQIWNSWQRSNSAYHPY